VNVFPSPAPIMKLMATLRSSAGVPVGFRATGNPGGPGHQWVRTRYIDPAPLGNVIIRDDVTGLNRIFIPSKVERASALALSLLRGGAAGRNDRAARALGYPTVPGRAMAVCLWEALTARWKHGIIPSLHE
jgi:hypothetical protein